MLIRFKLPSNDVVLINKIMMFWVYVALTHTSSHAWMEGQFFFLLKKRKEKKRKKDRENPREAKNDYTVSRIIVKLEAQLI